MAIREDLVASAVTFLQDPSVAASPIENRIAFLQSKNLAQEEIDIALARANGEAGPSNYSNYAHQQQMTRQPLGNYGAYQQYPWHQPQSPPELPKRDWRDWFIMATVIGGVGYGMYAVARRYVIPLIAPPTPPQLEQDKHAIDESFEKAFSLLDQLAKDTESLKASEQARTERLDTALTDVESVINELKTASRRREDESRHISEEVRGLKDLIPKAMEAQKETTDTRLQELNSELKSLKKLMGQRMNPAPSTVTASSYSRYPGNSSTSGQQTPTPTATGSLVNSVPSSTEVMTPKPASVSNVVGSEAAASPQGRSSSPFSSGVPSGRSAIPAWQMAAASKSTSGSNPAETSVRSQEAADGS